MRLRRMKSIFPMKILLTVIVIKATIEGEKNDYIKRGNDSIKINAKPTAFKFIMVQWASERSSKETRLKHICAHFFSEDVELLLVVSILMNIFRGKCWCNVLWLLIALRFEFHLLEMKLNYTDFVALCFFCSVFFIWHRLQRCLKSGGVAI